MTSAPKEVCYLLLEERPLQQFTLQYPPLHRNLEPAAYELQGFGEVLELVWFLVHGVSDVFADLPDADGHDVAWSSFPQHDGGSLTAFFLELLTYS